MSRWALSLFALSALFVTPHAGRADDASGVSPNRLHLPKGPGSLEGVGENVEPNINMGLMAYSVPIALPSGYEGMTPSLSIIYNSGSGNSEVGLGWSLPIPSIERMTSRGLPRYIPEDLFAANGSDELVRLPGTNIYRARFEGGFVRYRWMDEDDGHDGYWKAEYPDGRVGYFGAYKNGELEPRARVGGPDGVFRYHLCEIEDVLGHRIVFEYEQEGGLSFPSRISYVFVDDEPRFQVLFNYEDRSDQISDAKPGFEVRCTQRLVSIQVLSRGEQIHRYGLSYEEAAAGLSRLKAVHQYGIDDEGPYPIAFQFAYSGGLGESCEAGMCNAPEVVEMGGALGIDFRTGTADLVDLNGDALPDIVDTRESRHQIFLNVLEDGEHRFADATVSQTGSANLTSKSVQMFDADGDGFADMVNAETKAILYNSGEGDWERSQIVDELDLPDFEEDADIRFFDFDSDKRIDIIHSDGSNTWYWINQGGGRFSIEEDVELLSAGFTEDNLQLADMNGDGLQDIVQVTDESVNYKMYYGRGRFGDWIEMDNPISAPASELKMRDLNGDSLADAVYVEASDVYFALNKNGTGFESNPTVLSASSSLPIVEKTSDVSLRYADMNGNGSTDIVWIDSSGKVTYLDLFPNRPNLLTRIVNGIGKVIEINYGSSAAHMVKDGGAGSWTRRVPSPMLTVDAITTYDTFSGVPQEQTFRYHNGYYDGEEAQFRGFIDVDVTTSGDAHVEKGTAQYHFDVGESDRYRKGLLLQQTTSSGRREINTVENSYDDCDVGGVSGDTEFPIRFICQVGTRQIVKEGLDQSHWVTIDQSFEYDAYGNRTLASNFGVTSEGGQGCEACSRDEDVFGEPCGNQCQGDESFERTTFVSPDNTDGRWILHHPASKQRSGSLNADISTEERFYYDGEAFEGLSLGTLEQGLLTRTEAKVSSDENRFVQVERMRRDEHGAVVEVRDPNDHRRTFEYDSASLLLLSETIWFDDSGHEPYGLRMSADYHPSLDTVVASSRFMRVENGGTVSDPHLTLYKYDNFGRLVALAKPGDTLDSPTEEYDYALGDPISSIMKQGRSKSGEALDLETVQCFDGLGRAIQTRTRIEEGRYQVSGFSVYNVLGEPSLSYQPYIGSSAQCDTQAPSSVLFIETYFDASGRAREVIQPDADLYQGTSSRSTMEYKPLRTITNDEEDNNVGGEHNSTPTVTITDGLGRTVTYVRSSKPNISVPLYLTYDSLSNLRGYVDVKGNEKRQYYDLLGRVVRVEDPDSGTTTFTYDYAGNTLFETDARNITIERNYDEANRLVSEFEQGNRGATLVSYRYDKAPETCERCIYTEGLPASVSYPIGEDLMGYDERGQAIYLQRRIDSHDFELETEYDNAGRTVSERYPAGPRLNYKLDGAGRVTGINEFVNSVIYEDRGMLQAFELGNGVKTEYGFDARMRLSTLVTQNSEGESYQDYTYDRDRVGNIMSITDIGIDEDTPSANATYRYDAWYRLREVELDKNRTGEETLSFDYDEIDNILSKTSNLGESSPDHVGTYAYGENNAGPHAVTTAGLINLAYDSVGNMIERDEDKYQWDFLGRMHRATRGEDILGEYNYGPTRDRVKKTENGQTTYYVSPEFEIRDGIAVLYVKFSGRKLVKIEIPDFASGMLPDLAPGVDNMGEFVSNPDGLITSGDAWIAQAALIEALKIEQEVDDSTIDALLTASARRLLVYDDREKLTYIHYNHLGTTAATTDSEGTIILRTECYPYGLPRYTNVGYTCEYSYSGKEQDEGTQLLYFGARYLDATLARWTSPDTFYRLSEQITTADDTSSEYTNPFVFSRGSPVTRIDREGYSSEGEADGGWLMPVEGGRISSGYREEREDPVEKASTGKGTIKPHRGWDIAAPIGTPIRAAQNGRLADRKWEDKENKKKGFGKFVAIEHDDGKVSYYGHMSKYNEDIKVGSRVNKGDIIGFVGSTGKSTGPHVHFEVRPGFRGKGIDPATFMSAAGTVSEKCSSQLIMKSEKWRPRNLNELMSAFISNISFGSIRVPRWR